MPLDEQGLGDTAAGIEEHPPPDSQPDGRDGSEAPDSTDKGPPPPDDISKHEHDNDNDSKCCVICMDGDRIWALYPCGHLALCEECRHNHSVITCPMCRNDVKDIVRIYNT